jgi:uncharacterized membrane protein
MPSQSSLALPSAKLLTGVAIAGLALMLSALAAALVGRLLNPDVLLPRDYRLIVLAHLLTVIPCVPLALAILLRMKGDAAHRVMGTVWLVLMAITAALSFGITLINTGHFSPIHILSIATLVGVARAWWTARRGDVESHQRTILILIIAGLGVAGGFTFLPSRYLGQLVFGA